MDQESLEVNYMTMDWLVICYNCGLPLNEAVMAGNGNYLCCSGSENSALW